VYEKLELCQFVVNVCVLGVVGVLCLLG